MAEFHKSHFFRLCVYISHFISLTSCLSPRLKYPPAYLTFPLGTKSTRHLKFNMSNTKLKISFPHPTCSSWSLSHLSRWYHFLPSCSGQKNLGVILGSSFALPHIQCVSRSHWCTLYTAALPCPAATLIQATTFSCLCDHGGLFSSLVLFLSLIIHSPHITRVVFLKNVN